MNRLQSLTLCLFFSVFLIIFVQTCDAETDWLIPIAVKHKNITQPVDIFIAEHDSEAFLVAIAQVEIKDRSKSEKLKARLVAKSLSLKALNSFINSVQISSTESINQTSSYLTLEREGVPTRRVLLSEVTKYEESIIESGNGFLKALIDLTEWVDLDQRTYNYALAVKL